jgi:S1-C subfamily serine protease
MLDTDGAGPGLRIQNVLPESGARQAGLQTSDRLLSVADQTIHSMQDVRLALLDKSPGDAVLVTIVRNEQNSSQEIVLSVTLQ